MHILLHYIAIYTPVTTLLYKVNLFPIYVYLIY